MEENIIRLNPGTEFRDEPAGDYSEKIEKIERIENTEKIETENDSIYRNMLNDHLQLIERQSFRAVQERLNRHGMFKASLTVENEALELSTRVIDTLTKDNYHVLRMFKGTSRLSTYITAIIARLSVDMIRKKLGRSREKERAQKFGKIGLLIYEKAICQEVEISELYSNLENTGEISISIEEFTTIANVIIGKKSSDSPSLIELEPGSPVKNGFSVHTEENENDCIVIPDTGSNPEERLISGQQEEKMKEMVNTMIEELTGEERLILRMRFPTENGEKTGKIDRISTMLGISEKAVYKRISRIMEKCRAVAKRKGVNIHDLLS